MRRRLVGGALRRYRENVGYALEDAARVLECDRSKISRIETGQRGIRAKELRELLTEYGVPASEQLSGHTAQEVRIPVVPIGNQGMIEHRDAHESGHHRGRSLRCFGQTPVGTQISSGHALGRERHGPLARFSAIATSCSRFDPGKIMIADFIVATRAEET